LGVPMALAVSPAVLTATRKHCDDLGRRGYLCVPFTDKKAATSWASGFPPRAVH
jgi:hypothetical protein